MKTILTAFNARYSHSSLALRYLQKYNNEFDIEIMEFSINDDVHSIYNKLLKGSADAYCFSCYVWNIELILKVAEMISLACPSSTIILGGPESGYNAKILLERYSFIDVIIKGEGEDALGNVLDKLSKGEKPERFIEGSCVDLARIPMPYTKEDIQSLEGKIIYFETSRGCPFNCAYCLSSAEHGVRYFPMDYVKAGFELLFQERVPLVKLIDRTFNSNENRAFEIVQFIIEHSEVTRVHFEIEPQILTDKLIDLLVTAPKDMFQLEIGIQTINEKALNAVNRRCETEITKENILKLKRTGNMHIHLDLIAGLPYEDYQSFGKSFDYVYSMKPDMLQLGFLKVLPGTEIENFRNENTIQSVRFSPYEVVSTSWVSADELCRLKEIENAVDLYYNSGKFSATIQRIESVAGKSYFEIYEELAKLVVKATENGKIKQVKLYEILFEKFGDEVIEELAIDFLRNNKTTKLPYFLVRNVSKTFKKRYVELLCDESFISETGISKDLKDLRFENILDKVYVSDYKNNKILDITKWF